MTHMMLEAKRATRGTRMSSLVGQAAEDDDAFWGHDVWNEGEGSDEESFHTQDEEDKPDEFDSDFNESESEDEEEEDEEEERAAQRGGKVQKKSSSQYKEPGPLKGKVKGAIKNPFAMAAEKADSTVNNDDDDDAMDVDGDDDETPAQMEERYHRKAAAKEQKRVKYEVVPRIVRDSTKSKTKNADVERTKREKEEKKNRKQMTAKPTKSCFKMRELLEEALQTEEENKKWLESRKFWLQHKEEQERKTSNAGDMVTKDYIRYYSRRNVGTYVTFSSSAAVPECLRPEANNPPPPPPDSICVITGLPAKYRDPKTMLPYANTAAFKELRRRHESGKLKQRSPSSTSTNRKVILANQVHSYQSSYNLNHNSSSSSAQKTVRVAAKPTITTSDNDANHQDYALAFDDINNSNDVSNSIAATVNTAAVLPPPLSITRTLSQTSVRSGSLSQHNTPRHGLPNSSSKSANSLIQLQQTLSLSSPTSPQGSRYQLQQQQYEEQLSQERQYQISRHERLASEAAIAESQRMQDYAQVAEVIRTGRTHQEYGNIVYVAPFEDDSHAVRDSVAQVRWPAGIQFLGHQQYGNNRRAGKKKNGGFNHEEEGSDNGKSVDDQQNGADSDDDTMRYVSKEILDMLETEKKHAEEEAASHASLVLHLPKTLGLIADD